MPTQSAKRSARL